MLLFAQGLAVLGTTSPKAATVPGSGTVNRPAERLGEAWQSAGLAGASW